MTTEAVKKSIREVHFDEAVFKSLSKEEQAFLIVVCHATSEINTFGRLAFLSTTKAESSGVLKAALVHQNLSILRCFSAKLLEFAKIFRKRQFGKKCESISGIYDFADAAFERLSLSADYGTVRNIRDFVTNHYDPEKTKKNLDHLAPCMNLSLYLMEPNSNAFAFVGEEVSFTAQFNREFSSRNLPEGSSGFSLWWKWNRDAWGWARDIHAKTVEVLLLQRVPDLSYQDIDLSVSRDLVFGKGSVLPIFSDEEFR